MSTNVPKSGGPAITFEVERITQALVKFLRQETETTGRDNFVVGLSGGIDSALAASLAVRAVGAHKVFGVLMPYKTSSPDSLKDAQELVAWLEVESRTVPITPMLDAYFSAIEADDVRRGNKMARERMTILFDIAHERRGLVLGTGNRTEIALGYTTMYGDSACSLNPLGQLYKTEVRQLARYLNVPAAIQEKEPSADLWVGQTDEDEIGVTYERVDRILRRIIDDGVHTKAILLAEGFTEKEIDRVVGMVNHNYFKRQMPPIAQLDKPPIPLKITLLD